MKHPVLCLFGWILMIEILLYASFQVTFAMSRFDIICHMVMEISCDGGFINMISPVCEHHKRAVFGKECTADSECKYQHGLCLEGTCSCGPGYIYSFDSDQCMLSPKVFGKKCSATHECSYQHGLRLAGTCFCTTGHSYNFQSGECTTSCSIYGKTVLVYRGSGVRFYNVKKFWKLKQTDCTERCLYETTFVCINVEFNIITGKCFLCDKTWADIKEENRATGYKNWNLWYRHCHNNTFV